MLIDRLSVHSHSQRMLAWSHHTAIKTYDVSTAKNGMGENENSEKTPRGWHQIIEKYGDTAALNSVFVARKWTGEIYSPSLRNECPNRDWILSRILRLTGLEAGINQGPGVDTYNRYIYIHGTPDDVLLGQPGSHGCIRMANDDIIELFAMVTCDTRVFIE